MLAVDTGAKWREQNVDLSPFYTNKEIDRLIAETETIVTTELEGGDRQKAMKRLRVPPLNEQKSPWTTFKVGLFSGSFIVLFIAAVLSGNSVLLNPIQLNHFLLSHFPRQKQRRFKRRSAPLPRSIPPRRIHLSSWYQCLRLALLWR